MDDSSCLVMDDSSVEQLECLLASLKTQIATAHNEAVVEQKKRELKKLIVEETQRLEQIRSKEYDPSKSTIGKTPDNSQKKSGVWESGLMTTRFASVVTPNASSPSPPSQEWKVINPRQSSVKLNKWRDVNKQTQQRLLANRLGSSNYNLKVGENHVTKFSNAIEKLAQHVLNTANKFENNDEQYHELELNDSDNSCRETILISSPEGQKLIASYGVACDSKYLLNVEYHKGKWYVVRQNSIP